MKYTNSVDLAIDCYKKADIDNMLLSYSTGSYVDYNLANKVSTTGDASISGNLDVGQDQAQTAIKPYVNHIGKQVMWKWKPDGLIKVISILKLIIQMVCYYLLLKIR